MTKPTNNESKIAEFAKDKFLLQKKLENVIEGCRELAGRDGSPQGLSAG